MTRPEVIAFPSQINNWFKQSNNYSLNLMGLKTNSFENFKFFLIGANKQIPNIYPSFTPTHYRKGAFFNLNCNTSKELFVEVSNDVLLNMSFVFLTYSDDYNSSIKFLESSTLAFDSNVFLATNGTVFDLYRIKPEWDVIANKIGSYNVSITLDMKDLNKRTNMNGTTIKSSLALVALQFDGTQEAKNHLLDPRFLPEFDFLSRLGYSVHSHLEPVYNFSHDLIITNEWGEYNETVGHWTNGMFRELEQGNADIGLSISRIFSRRVDAIFYFPPSLTYRACFIFKHPSTLATLTALVKPFTLNSWLCTILFIGVSGMALWYIKKLTNEPTMETDITGSALIALGTICQQGLVKDSHGLSTRVLSFFLLLLGLFIYTFYGASIVGFLLRPSPRTINTIDKLIQSPLVKYSENLQYLKTHFKNPFTENIAKTYQAIKGKTPDQDRYIDIGPGMKEVQKGGTALYSQDTNLYVVIEKTLKSSEICALAEVEIIVAPISTVIRKKSPYRELFYRGYD